MFAIGLIDETIVFVILAARGLTFPTFINLVYRCIGVFGNPLLRFFNALVRLGR